MKFYKVKILKYLLEDLYENCFEKCWLEFATHITYLDQPNITWGKLNSLNSPI